jgi:cytochrome oxidase Cu insertion factor (SCO1/SenC/PrrC family)
MGKDYKLKKKRSIRSPLSIIFIVALILVVSSSIIGINTGNDNFTNVNNNSGLPTDEDEDSGTYGLSQTVTTVDGDTFSLSVYDGKPLIIYFSGVECPACNLELPYLVDAWNNHKSSGRFNMICFDIEGSTVGEIKDWMSDNGVTWDCCQDTGYQMSSDFSVYSMPTLVIINSNGYESDRYVGAQSESTINTIFDNL